MTILAEVNVDLATIDWKVIIAALAFVVALITLIYFQWWRNRKRLSYEILSNVELVSSKKIRDKVEIRFEGQPVESVHLLVVKLINDGFQPIKKDEFEKPVKFVFRGGNVLSAEREKFQPENIGTEISYKDRCVEIAPALFNRKDYIQFKVLLDGFYKIEVDARIVGVSINEGTNSFRRWRWFLVIPYILASLASGSVLATSELPLAFRLVVFTGVVTMGMFIGTVWAGLETRR